MGKGCSGLKTFEKKVLSYNGIYECSKKSLVKEAALPAVLVVEKEGEVKVHIMGGPVAEAVQIQLEALIEKLHDLLRTCGLPKTAET